MTEPKPEAADFWITFGVLSVAFVVTFVFSSVQMWMRARTKKPPITDCPECKGSGQVECYSQEMMEAWFEECECQWGKR